MTKRRWSSAGRPGEQRFGDTAPRLRLPEGVLVTAILRDGQLSVPRGDSMLEARDRVFLTGEAEATIVAAGRLTGQHGVPKEPSQWAVERSGCA